MKVTARLAENGTAVSIEVEGSQITAVRSVAESGESGLLVSPGLIDMQINGFAGYNFNSSAITTEQIGRLVQSLLQHGVTTICPTVVTESHQHMETCIRNIVRACGEDPAVDRAVACIHVEGPYFSPEDGPRGAHAAEHVRPPDWEEFSRWQQSACGRIGIITLAPEYPEAPDFVTRAAASGVLVSIGHTSADSAQIARAVDAGARFSTHLGNGAHALIKRHPNYIWDQLADDRLTASLIFDGHHLPASVMKVMLRAKGLERCVLVSDSVATGGLTPGIYERVGGAKVELLPSGRLVLQGTPYLAGSANHLLDGVNNAISLAGLSTADALRLATANPARSLGLGRKAGCLMPGALANLVVFSRDSGTGRLTVEATMVSGEWVYDRKGMWTS